MLDVGRIKNLAQCSTLDIRMTTLPICRILMEGVGLGREFKQATDRDMQFRDDKSSRRISVKMQNVTYQL